MYSACQADECRCTGWKTPDETRKGDVENAYIPQLSEECRNPVCQHSLEQHISHLADVTDEQTYELLGAVVDVENLYMSMHNEKDDDTKKVYYFLFRVSGHFESENAARSSSFSIANFSSCDNAF